MSPKSFISNTLARSSWKYLIIDHHLSVWYHQHKVEWPIIYLPPLCSIGFIYLTLCEAQPSEVVIYPGVPSMGCLLQPIQCSLELAHMRLTVKGLKTFRLLYVHLFLNHSIKEHCLYIHLMYLSTHVCWYCQYRSDRWVPFYKSKGILIVIPLYLWKAAGNKSCLILLHTTIWSFIYLVNPLGSDRLLVL